MRVADLARQEDAVLAGDGGEVAGAHTDKGVARRRRGRRLKAPGSIILGGAEKFEPRGMEELLPRVRADKMVEVEGILAGDDAVLAGRLLVAPAARQIVQAGDFFQHEGGVAEARADEGEARGAQVGENLLEGALGQGQTRADAGEARSHGAAAS